MRVCVWGGGDIICLASAYLALTVLMLEPSLLQTLSMVGKIFIRRHIEIFCSYFSRKCFDISCKLSHANCLHRRQFAWNVKTCFLGKKKYQFVVCCISTKSGKRSNFYERISKSIIKFSSWTQIRLHRLLICVTTKNSQTVQRKHFSSMA